MNKTVLQKAQPGRPPSARGWNRRSILNPGAQGEGGPTEKRIIAFAAPYNPAIGSLTFLYQDPGNRNRITGVAVTASDYNGDPKSSGHSKAARFPFSEDLKRQLFGQIAAHAGKEVNVQEGVRLAQEEGRLILHGDPAVCVGIFARAIHAALQQGGDAAIIFLNEVEFSVSSVPRLLRCAVHVAGENKKTHGPAAMRPAAPGPAAEALPAPAPVG